jgi:hypothetical protein
VGDACRACTEEPGEITGGGDRVGRREREICYRWSSRVILTNVLQQHRNAKLDCVLQRSHVVPIGELDDPQVAMALHVLDPLVGLRGGPRREGQGRAAISSRCTCWPDRDQAVGVVRARE